MAKFVLVHGGAYGAWCWEMVRSELEGGGHQTWAPELPIEDVRAGIDDYIDVIRPNVIEAGSDAVLVGHSMGGRIIAYAAQRLQVGGLVFLCATVPGASEHDAAEVRDHLTDDVNTRLKRDDFGRLYYDPDDARHVFFHDCSDKVADSAIKQLRRQAVLPIQQTRVIGSFPDVPIRYVVCSEDRAVRPGYGRDVAREVLHTEAVEIASSHSPFLSRPRELARVLIELADDMALGRTAGRSASPR